MNLERKLNDIDAKCAELRLMRKHAQDRTNKLSVEAMTAVVVDRFPGAAFIAMMMISEYSDDEVPTAILDDRGWPLWFQGMIGPKRPEDEAFEDRIAKYALQLEGNSTVELQLPEPRHSAYADRHSFRGRTCGDEEVYGLLVLG